MSICTISRKSFSFFLFFYSIIAIGLILYLPFTQVESSLLQKSSFFITELLSKMLFELTHSYIVVRVLFFLISLGSLYLLYEIAKSFLKEKYLYLALVVYLLTPGVFVSFVILNFATLAIFFSLLFLYGYLKKNYLFQVTSLVLLFFTNTAAFLFYFAVMLFSFFKKEWLLFLIAIFLFSVNVITSHYFIGGIPKGHLVELFVNYAVIFSPLYFIVVVYTLYRVAREKDFSILWLISVVFFLFSVFLSIRQKVDAVQFAPFIVIFTPIVVYIFQQSISIRLKQFQKWHLHICQIVIIIMAIETLLVAFSYPIYQLSDHRIKIINSRIYTIKDKNL